MTAETSGPAIVGAEELLRLAVPVVGAAVQRVGPLNLAVVRVNTQRRRDIADLARVHRIEGVGSAGARWYFALGTKPDVGILHVVVREPVACSFALWLEIARHRRVLEHLSKNPIIVVAPAVVPLARLPWESIAFAVPTAELPDVLAATAAYGRPRRRRDRAT